MQSLKEKTVPLAAPVHLIAEGERESVCPCPCPIIRHPCRLATWIVAVTDTVPYGRTTVPHTGAAPKSLIASWIPAVDEPAANLSAKRMLSSPWRCWAKPGGRRL